MSDVRQRGTPMPLISEDVSCYELFGMNEQLACM